MQGEKDNICSWCGVRVVIDNDPSYQTCQECFDIRSGVCSGTTTINESVARGRFYKKELDDGVRGADIIQPLDERGKPNQEFVEHYGVANYTPEHKEYIRDKFGRDANREKDWRK